MQLSLKEKHHWCILAFALDCNDCSLFFAIIVNCVHQLLCGLSTVAKFVLTNILKNGGMWAAGNYSSWLSKTLSLQSTGDCLNTSFIVVKHYLYSTFLTKHCRAGACIWSARAEAILEGPCINLNTVLRSTALSLYLNLNIICNRTALTQSSIVAGATLIGLSQFVLFCPTVWPNFYWSTVAYIPIFTVAFNLIVTFSTCTSNLN